MTCLQQRQEVTTEQSLTLMKNLIRTAVSSVCYLRNLLPEDCFQEKKMTDITVKTIKPGSHPQAALIIQWLELGVFDALTRGYLDSIVFAVMSPGKDAISDPKLVESYHFRVNYTGEEPRSMELKGEEFSKESIKTATCRMIRTLVVLAQTLNTLPNSRVLTLKLQYRDEYTPAEYEPQFFRAARDNEILEFTETPLKIRVGNISTPYHEMSMKLKTISDTLGAAAEDPIENVPTVEITSEQQIESGDESNQETQDPDESERNFTEVTKLLEQQPMLLDSTNTNSVLRTLAKKLPHLSRRTIQECMQRYKQKRESDLSSSLGGLAINKDGNELQEFVEHVQSTHSTNKQALLEHFSESVIEKGFLEMQKQGLAKKTKAGRWQLLKSPLEGVSKALKRKLETGELSLSQISIDSERKRKTSVLDNPLLQNDRSDGLAQVG